MFSTVRDYFVACCLPIESTMASEANQESGTEPNTVISNSANNALSETTVPINGSDRVNNCLEPDDAVRKSISNVKVQTVEDHEQKNCLRKYDKLLVEKNNHLPAISFITMLVMFI